MSCDSSVFSGEWVECQLSKAMWKPSRYCLRPRCDRGDELLRRLAGLFRREHDRRAVRVVGADEMHLVALHALEAHPDVGLDVLHDVADVERPVGVGQGGGDEEPAGHLLLETCAGKTAILAYTSRMPLSEADVQAVLAKLVDPNTGKDFVATRSARNIKVDGRPGVASTSSSAIRARASSSRSAAR